MSNFKWHREFVTPKSYKKNMEISDQKEAHVAFKIEVEDNPSEKKTKKTINISQDFLDAIHGSKELTAYTVASDIRKFEIGLFWQRAAYFWAFITVVYTAYFKVLVDIYEKQHGHFPLVTLCALGLFFSFSWYLTSKASKHWQENWELHLDLLEDGVTGPLYKTYLEEKSYSVSKINIFAGVIVSMSAGGLLLYEFAVFVKNQLHLSRCLGVLTCLAFLWLIGFGLFVYAKISIGNKKNSDSITLQRKVYE